MEPRKIKTGPLDPKVVEWTDKYGYAGKTTTPLSREQRILINRIVVGLGLVIGGCIGLVSLLAK